MRNTSTANTILALGVGFLLGSFCQTKPLAANADNTALNVPKATEQKVAAKLPTSRLQFDKQAHVHRFALHSKQDLMLDQGF